MTISVSRTMQSISLHQNFQNAFVSQGPWKLVANHKPSSFSNANQKNPFSCIDTVRRSYATTIQPTIDQDKFFNREREIKALTTMLKMEPQLSIISGPVNSGKTSLILKILKDVSKDNERPVLHIDLRERSFDTVDSLASSLNAEMSSWLDRFGSVSKKLDLNASAYGFTLGTSFQSNQKEKLPIDRLNSLFEAMSKQLPPHSWWSGAKSPILFIDEASRLNALLKDKDGHAALTNMFEWFVRNTKQHNRFHVILGSSDSFFHLWVQRYIGSSRFNSYVVGDLAKPDAQLFWDKHVITQLNSIDSKLPAPKFDDAYSVCGGNMFLLKKYFNQYVQKEGKNFEKNDFFLVGSERAKLTNALFKNGNGSSSSHSGNGKPIWTRDQFITVMEKLVASEGGFLIYEDLCEEISQPVVDALIDYNLLHLRPSKDFTYDLPEYDATKAILTAETPSSLVAMRNMLEDLNS